MEGTVSGWGPVTAGRGRMGFVTWGATVYTTTMMMETAVTQMLQMCSRPVLILTLLTGKVVEQMLSTKMALYVENVLVGVRRVI